MRYSRCNLFLACLLGSLIFILPVWANDSPRRPLQLNLNQLENILIGKNSSLWALYYQLEQALYQQEEEYFQGWPKLRVNYNYYPEGQLGDDDSVSIYEHRGEVALVYSLIDGLLNRRYSQQEKQAIVEERQALFQAGQLELLRKLRHQYAAALKEKQLLAEYSQREMRLSQWLEQVKQRYYHKQSRLPEVLEIETCQLTNQQLLEQHRQNYSLKLAHVTQFVGLENRKWELLPPLATPTSLPNKQYLLSLLDQHPLIGVQRLKASRDKLRLAGSWLERLKLEAQAGYIVEEERDGDYQAGSRLGLRFSIPLAYQQLQDYRQLSLLDEQKRWEAEAETQKQSLTQQLMAAYILLEGMNAQRELVQRQIEQAKAKISFLSTQREYPLTEPDHPWQRLLVAYQQQWKARDRLIELDYQEHIAYYDLLYLSGQTRFPEPASGMSLTHSSVANPQSHPAPRALYIKDSGRLATPEQQKFLLRFCQAKGINQILLNTNQLFASAKAPNWMPELIAGLHQLGIPVWAVMTPENLSAPDVAQAIDPAPLLGYQQRHIGSEAFDGLHLHLTLPGRPVEEAGQLKLKANRLLAYCGQLYRQLKALPHPLKLALTIPYWYDQLDMQLLVDSIYYADELMVILPERLEAAKLLEEVQAELDMGQEMGRRVWLALDCGYLSRHNQPRLEEYMQQLQGRWPYRLGFAIFDYQTYQALQEKTIAP